MKDHFKVGVFFVFCSITNGQATLTTPTVIDGLDVSYDSVNKKYVASEKGSTPAVEVLCKANTTKATALVYNGSGDPSQESSYTSEEVGLLASEATTPYDVGVTYTCELGDGEENTFYVLETSEDNVLLIAGMNLGSTVAWSEDGSNHKDEDASAQAVTAKAALKERTTGWIKLNQSQITLPSGQQLAAAGGDTKWTESHATETPLPTWLYSYTKFTTGTYGYWTSSPAMSYDYYAWIVFCDGSFDSSNVSYSSGFGVRPVITISKSQLG